MRVLGICSGAILSGKEFVAINVMNGLRKSGHSCKVVYSGWHNGAFKGKLEENKIEGHPIKLGWYYISKLLWSFDSLIHYPSGVRKYLKVQKAFSPDVIYIDSYRPVVLLKPFLKGKIIYHVNDPHAHSKLDKFLLRYAQNRINTFIAASEYIKKDLIQSGIKEDKIKVIHNGVEIPEEAIKKYIVNGIIKLGIVAQVIPRKGHEDLIKACSILKDSVPLELLIYGNGPKEYVSLLKKQISEFQLEDKVRWMGIEKDKNVLYNSFDILVAPTRNEEPFALVALESSTYKTPVIATRSGGFPESVIDNYSGFIVEKYSPEALAERIKYLYTNPEVLQKFGSQARGFINKNFTSGHMHEKFENALVHLA